MLLSTLLSKILVVLIFCNISILFFKVFIYFVTSLGNFFEYDIYDILKYNKIYIKYGKMIDIVRTHFL